jgi:hypothetical protein
VCVVIERATSVLFELEHAYSMILYGFTLIGNVSFVMISLA